MGCASAPETSVICSSVVHSIVATKLFSTGYGRSFVYCSERRSRLGKVTSLEAVGVKFLTGKLQFSLQSYEVQCLIFLISNRILCYLYTNRKSTLSVEHLYMEELETFQEFHEDKTEKALTQVSVRAPH